MIKKKAVVYVSKIGDCLDIRHMTTCACTNHFWCEFLSKNSVDTCDPGHYHCEKKGSSVIMGCTGRDEVDDECPLERTFILACNQCSHHVSVSFGYIDHNRKEMKKIGSMCMHPEMEYEKLVPVTFESEEPVLVLIPSTCPLDDYEGAA